MILLTIGGRYAAGQCGRTQETTPSSHLRLLGFAPQPRPASPRLLIFYFYFYFYFFLFFLLYACETKLGWQGCPTGGEGGAGGGGGGGGGKYKTAKEESSRPIQPR